VGVVDATLDIREKVVGYAMGAVALQWAWSMQPGTLATNDFWVWCSRPSVGVVDATYPLEPLESRRFFEAFARTIRLDGFLATIATFRVVIWHE
jgi:hypothetical protein